MSGRKYISWSVHLGRLQYESHFTSFVLCLQSITHLYQICPVAGSHCGDYRSRCLQYSCSSSSKSSNSVSKLRPTTYIQANVRPVSASDRAVCLAHALAAGPTMPHYYAVLDSHQNQEKLEARTKL
ncbi:hypothetical protein N7510_003002 [Penicillium lagena]|uniref:uncharacterized protein n=1 Tax=Penicillium lagena TaxID=94218 RepID=UPI0025424440|nr:uncharacterized protein N7510_003002 [Penicillium lagena]KAJ5619018.1 hypothetical protein N7510_003002 [Penicillium lagena]